MITEQDPSHRVPILILSPVSVDNSPRLVLRGLSDPEQVLGVARILRRTEHVSIIALGAPDLIPPTRDVAGCEFERSETNTVRLTPPSLPSRLVEDGKHLNGTVRNVSPHNALHVRAGHDGVGCVVMVMDSASRDKTPRRSQCSGWGATSANVKESLWRR